MELKTDNKFNCWLWFMTNRQEELYNVINIMISDKINEVLPLKVDEYMRQNIDKLKIDVITQVNGKESNLDGLKEDIKNIIMRSFK